MKGNNEVWCQIGSTKYDVSNFGRVRSWKRRDKDGNLKILKPQRLNGHHLAVCIDGQFQYVHRLVEDHFGSTPDPTDDQVCHWDDDPTNNRVSNLYRGNARTNAQDRKFNRPTAAIIDATAARNQKIHDDIVAMADESGLTPDEVLDLLKTDRLSLLYLRI